MRRLLWPLGAALALAAVVVGGTVVPVQPVPAVEQQVDDRARASVVCPADAGTDGSVIAAAGPAGQLATAALADGSTSAPVTGSYGEVTSSTPILVSAPRTAPFSATSRASATAGSDRGLSMMSCIAPSSASVFAGLNSSGDGVADLVLINADSQDAAADLTFYGPEGVLSAPGSRGIVVAAHSRRVVPIGPLVQSEQLISMRVSTSSGRVAAAVRQRAVRDDRPAGADWLPPTAAPAAETVITGVPAGKGNRDLVVVNPGERTASVALQVMGADGPTAIPGFETIDLPPQTSRTVPLGGALAQAGVGLRLTSEAKVAAAVISTGSGAVTSVDLATQVATPALSGPGVLALSPPFALAPVLHLSNAAAEPTRVRVVVGDGNGTLLDSTVDVPGTADITLTLPRLEGGLVTVEPQTPGTVRASAVIAGRLDEVDALSSVALLPGGAAVTLPTVQRDPHLGE